MITTIRRQFKGESLRYAMWVILFALAVGYILPMLLKDGKGNWAIMVNGSEISDRIFAQQVAQEQERIAYIKEQYGPYAQMLFESQGISMDPYSLAYQGLVDQELLDQMGKELGVQIGSDFITQKLADRMFIMREQSLMGLVPPQVFDQAGGINREALQAHLRRRGMNIAEFEEAVARALVRRTMLEILSSAVYVPRFDVLQRYIAEYVGKKYSIVTISLETLINQEKKNEVKDADLEQFFNLENTKSKRYWVPEKRSGTVWTFKADAYGVQPSDEVISSYYEKNKMKLYVDEPVKVQVRRIIYPDQNQAEAARQEFIKNPEQFAKKSQLTSFFARDESDYGSTFEQASFSLVKNGDISPVVATDNGYELLQRVDRKNRTFKPLSAVKQEIKEMMAQRKFQDSFTDDLKRITRTAESKSASLADLAHKKGATSQKLEHVTKDASAQAQKLFGLKENGVAFYVDKGVGYVIQLNNIEQSYAPNFGAVRAQVLSDYYEYKARKKLATLLEDMKHKASTVSTQELASITHGTLEKTDWLTSKKREGFEALSKRGVPVTAMLQMEKAGSTIIHDGQTAGFIVRLEEIEPINQADFKQKEVGITRSLEQERRGDLILGFVASLARNARIEINESLMQHLQ